MDSRLRARSRRLRVGVSRVIIRLEARLGVRLLDRTTRSTGLTSDGAAYYETCIRILRDLEDANIALAQVRATQWQKAWM